MARFQDIVSNFLFLGLFVFAGLAFIITTQVQNEAPQQLGEDSLFNETFEQLQGNLTGLQSAGNLQYNQSISEEPKAGFGSIVLFSIVSTGKTAGNIIVLVFGIVLKIPVIVLGLPESITSVMFFWLIVLILISLWILYKLGG